METFTPVIVVQCSQCEWVGRQFQQKTLYYYDKKGHKRCKPICPKCNCEKLNHIKDTEFKILPEIKLPYLGG